jgi:TonB family protein
LGATLNVWHTSDGKVPVQSSGERVERVEYFEEKLQDALLSPLPSSADLDPARGSLYTESKSGDGNALSCVMLVPLLQRVVKDRTMPLGFFPTYCFDPQLSALRASSSFANPLIMFDNIAKFQNRFLPRDIRILEGGIEVLSAKVDSVTYLDAADPALTPTEPLDKLLIGRTIVKPVLDSRVEPVYPPDAKVARISGDVVLNGMIGKDGSVRDLRVISAPCLSLAESALTAVSQWRYKPLLLEGKPVATMTTINVRF